MLFLNNNIFPFLRKIFCFLLLLFTFYQQAAAQGMYTDFGQNRVQFEKFDWQFYRNENFDAYFYTGGKELAVYAMKVAEKHLKAMEKVMDYRISGRIEFVIYTTQSDFRQSNIGMTEVQINTGGVTRVYDTKVILTFDGDHEHFTQQIRAGLAEIIANEMLYGGTLTDRLQNAALLTLPEWYINGIINYLAEGWTVADDSRMKDALKTRRFKKFSTLTEDEAVFAGKSIWKFLIESNDERIVSNLLYITRVTRNIESSFYYVLGMRMHELTDNWEIFYNHIYEKDDQGKTLPAEEIKLSKKMRRTMLPQVSLSPMGNKLLLTTNDHGVYKIYTIDLYNKQREKIYRGGFKYRNMIQDKSFPLIGWHPNGKSIGCFYERKGASYFLTINLETGKKERFKLQKLDKVTGFEFNPSGNMVLLTGTRKGQSDLYLLDIKSQRERQLSNDFYDDKDAHYIDEGKRIIFASNRISDTLSAPSDGVLTKENNYDIFIYDLEHEDELLQRVTNTPYVNESAPMPYSAGYYSYLTDYNGVVNRYAVKVEPVFDFVELRLVSKDTSLRTNDTLFLDTLIEVTAPFSVRGKVYVIDSLTERVDTLMHYRNKTYTYPLTNYYRSVLAHDACVPAAFSVELIYNENSLRIYKTPNFTDIPEQTKDIATYYTNWRNKKSFQIKPFKRGAAFPVPSLWVRDTLAQRNMDNEPLQLPKVHPQDSLQKQPADSMKYHFLNEFTNRENFNIDQILAEQPVIKNISKEKQLRLPPPRTYRSVFLPDYFVTQLDNTVINTYYQPYTPGSIQFFNPGFNGMFKLGINDMFNDKRIIGGFRLSVDLRGTDVFLAYENNKRRVDKRIQYFRSSRFVQSDFDYQRTIVNEVRFIQKYVFTERSCLRFHVFGRQDVTNILSSDVFNAGRPSIERNWAGGKLEYIYDNTVNKGLNLLNGLRYKVFVETYRDVKKENTTLATAGIDIRNYLKIHRQLVLATRFSANTSFGSARVVYFLGGVDNWISPRYNKDILVDATKNYVYQSLATNLRGFTQNIRNGSSFVVMNNELRLPLFAYITNRPMKSDFLKNFMIVPFFDLGTAWSGKSPNADDNTFNKRVVSRYPITATIINIRQPLVGGVGAGLHLKLFGYYVRGDMAWGIEDMQLSKDPVYYVSLSTDF